MTTQTTSRNAIGAFVAGRRRAMTGAIPIRQIRDDHRTPGRSADPVIRPGLEPVFHALVGQWGCPLVDVPWTGRRPQLLPEGRVMDADEVLVDVVHVQPAPQPTPRHT